MDHTVKRTEIEAAASELILSLRDGRVWASWRDGRAPVELGEHEAVLAEMRLFILQSEAAEGLLRRAAREAGR